jgi:hypothetical protein
MMNRLTSQVPSGEGKKTSDHYITKHGTYIDGFAAPQEAEHPDMWAAKLVLEMTPKWFRNFWPLIAGRTQL